MATSIHNLTVNGNEVQVERFDFQSNKGIGERHIMIHLTQKSLSAKQQVMDAFAAYSLLLGTDMVGYTPVFRRIFLSDAANQNDLVSEKLSQESIPVATSVVEQPPLNGTKIAMWVYFLENVHSELLASGLHQVRHGAYTHYWGGTTTKKSGSSEEQTVALLSDYARLLDEKGLSLEDDCIRTWFFVQNVDVNYQGVVDGRNRVFDEHNLTNRTHFITSTGIGGRCADRNELVQLNTYAVGGLQPEQLKFLYAKDYLNSTYEYGVRFERGTLIDYGDRRHIFISGTASIDNKGNVLHIGEIDKQVHRMWQNVEALLDEGGCGFEDVAQMLVYLRDPADFDLVRKMFDERFPNTPKVILLAPVCRPTWLIEMECMAVKEICNTQFAEF